MGPDPFRSVIIRVINTRTWYDCFNCPTTANCPMNNWTEWLVKNKASNIPYIFEEIVMIFKIHSENFNVLFYKRLSLNPSNILIIRSLLQMLNIYCTQSVNVTFTGVIDLLGGVVGLMEVKASLLASHGFATLALAYLGYDDQPFCPSSITWIILKKLLFFQ